MAFLQGEEGPPSLEYIQAKDLFPPKELVKEEENLQVSWSWAQVGGVYAQLKNDFPPSKISKRTYNMSIAQTSFWVSKGGGWVYLYLDYETVGPREEMIAFLYSCDLATWQGGFSFLP